MSDFLYSNKRIKPGKLTTEIHKIYHDENPSVKEFHGKWGSLAVSHNLYNGYQPYETEDYIFVVVGGPILYFRDNDFIEDDNSNAGTIEIYNLWKKGRVKWDEDLSGPFSIIIINKQTLDLQFITDLMSFIPVYVYQDSTNTILSTHVDALASVSNQKMNYDTISCADFILHGVVTFPYTLYKGVYQVKPASVHQVINKSNELKSNAYWIPKEEYKYSALKNAADDLEKSLRKYINSITSQVSNIAQFISGGEDSRVLSSLLQHYPRDAFIFLDQMNREGKIAEKAANTYGANFKQGTRSKTHYIKILPNCSDLVGSGSQYHHAHTFGFHKSCNLNKYSAVFGGLFSDALLKGIRIKKIHHSDRLPLIPDIKNRKYSIEIDTDNNIFNKEILKELSNRRKAHLNYVKKFRNESAEEWFELWPSSMNMNIPNIHANRRLFRSYEPFMANDVVKISASVPQKWKLNRRLFHKATKHLLKPTKWLFHSDGRLPYFPWHINSILKFTYKVYSKAGKKTGIIKGNQGPWAEWKKVVNSKEWDKAILENSKGFQKISSIFKEKDIEKLLQDDNIFFLQRVNLMQILYQIRSKA